MEEATSILLKEGLLGAIIVLLIGVVIFMQRRIEKKEAENSQLYKDNAVIQEKWRISETERADRLMQTVNTASAVQSALVEKIQVGRGES